MMDGVIYNVIVAIHGLYSKVLYELFIYLLV